MIFFVVYYDKEINLSHLYQVAGSIGGFTVAGFTANGAVKLKIMVKGTAGAGVVTAATIKLGVNAAIKADASLQAYVDVDQVVDAQGNSFVFDYKIVN